MLELTRASARKKLANLSLAAREVNTGVMPCLGVA